MPPKRSSVSNKRTGSATAANAPAPQKPRRPLFQRYHAFVQWLHYHMHLLWISFLIWVSNIVARRQFRRGREQDEERNVIALDGASIFGHRKLVVVGDDFARGHGDWVQLFANYPPGLLNNVKWPLKDVMLRWHFFVCTKPGSSSAAWLPADKPSDDDWCPFAALCPFEQAFHPERGLHNDADVVVLSVGTMDRVLTSAQDTAKHVVRIAEALEARGKRVLIAHPLTPIHARDNLSDAIVEQMASRADYVEEEVRRRWPQQELADTMVKLGPRMDFMLTHPRHWRFGGRLLSSAGYQLWSKLWSDPLMLSMKAVEAPVYRALLVRQQRRKRSS